ncbi:hypothetical protein A2U01_0097987, partial [Trifolium medium]|nr:hypothetical protein [Trifolium medium]
MKMRDAPHEAAQHAVDR